MKYQLDPQAAAPVAPLFDGSQACTGADTTLFFPPPGMAGRAAVRQAKAICDTCEFLAPCLEYAMANGMVGVWGHTTTGERIAIRRRGQSPSLFSRAAA